MPPFQFAGRIFMGLFPNPVDFRGSGRKTYNVKIEKVKRGPRLVDFIFPLPPETFPGLKRTHPPRDFEPRTTPPTHAPGRPD